MACAKQGREAAVAAETKDLHLEVRLGQALAHDRIGERATARRVFAHELDQLRERSTDLALEHEGPHRAALVRHDSHRDPPPRARRAQEMTGGNTHVLEEDL